MNKRLIFHGEEEEEEEEEEKRRKEKKRDETRREEKRREEKRRRSLILLKYLTFLPHFVFLGTVRWEWILMHEERYERCRRVCVTSLLIAEYLEMPVKKTIF